MSEVGKFAETFANPKDRLRRRLGTVVSVQSDYTMTVTVGGISTSTVTGVRYFGHYAPEPGAQVWLDTDGVDVIAIGALAGSGGVAHAARVQKNTNQDADAAAMKVTFADVVSDPAGLFDNPNDRLTAILPGLYLISAGVLWSGTTDTSARTAIIRVTGTSRALVRQANIGVATSQLGQNVSCIMPMVQGDYAELWTNQGTAGTLTGGIQSDNATFLSMTYLGPAA